MIFSPCIGKCTYEGTHCEGCGRDHEEIAEMNSLVSGLVEFANKMEYENIGDFTEGVSHTIKYKMEPDHK
ncbi:MAG: DUF1289 domain-containing protein [Gammaproteobacteria bacterium]|nr:DUF1289 domain-containing protein [Gammaproteobacteria bacterium]